MTNKNVLSSPNSVSLLVSLYERDTPAKIMELAEDVGNYRAVKVTGDRLEREGLITIEEKYGGGKYFLYALTDRGKRIAEHLKEADDEYWRSLE